MYTYFIPFLIPVVGFFVRGVSGFGSALIITPLLLFFYDLRTVVAIVVILEIVSTAYFTIEVFKEVNWKYIKSLLPISVVGIAFGAFFLINFEADILKKIFGISVVLFSIRIFIINLSKFKIKRNKWPHFLTYIAGIFAGLLGGLYGTAGPPVTIFLENQMKTKVDLRATLTFYFYIIDLIRIIPYIYSGMIGKEQLKLSTIMLPAAFIGMLAGRLLYLKLSEMFFRILVGTILLASGILLVFF